MFKLRTSFSFVHIILSVLLVVMLFTGCKSNTQTQASIPIATLQGKLLAAADNLPDMTVFSSISTQEDPEELYNHYFGNDYNEVNSFFYYLSADSNRPGYAIAVIELKPDLALSEEEYTNRLNSDLKSFQSTYLNETTALLQNIEPSTNESEESATDESKILDRINHGTITVIGRYAALFITDNNLVLSETLKEQFEE